MFWSRNKKNRYTPVYPSYCNTKVGYEGYTFQGHVFSTFCFIVLSLAVVRLYIFNVLKRTQDHDSLFPYHNTVVVVV